MKRRHDERESPDNSENMGDMQLACPVAVSLSGLFMLGDVQDSLIKQTGMVCVIHFTRDR